MFTEETLKEQRGAATSSSFLKMLKKLSDFYFLLTARDSCSLGQGKTRFNKRT